MQISHIIGALDVYWAYDELYIAFNEPESQYTKDINILLIRTKSDLIRAYCKYLCRMSMVSLNCHY